ncbi:DNA-3-methyladenine glycosylase family protein [Nocardioides caldifontis]|uniref:DNA-3-methyladenine glycosylase family protein n=1 Tax=Nocardioides caldifontis TaxID=2588938 RepID=UPI001EF0A163|nr:AlkA N-terminal domain-containing protein [Nocardioides caldifontis]
MTSPLPERVELRLPVRPPFAAGALLSFLAHHVVPGVEVAGPGWYARTLDLPHGPGTLRLELADPPAGPADHVTVSLALADRRDVEEAVAAARRVVDADHDPAPVDAHLGGDAVLGPLVAQRPGLRVPGQVDAAEVAVRTVVGQQVSVVGARTVTGRLVAEHGTPVATGVPGLTHLFPAPAVLARVDPASLPMPRARGRALTGLCAALAEGAVALGGDPDPADVRRTLLALPGVGPWTADYVAMRALGAPDVFLPTDVGVRRAATLLGHDLATVLAATEAWRPWRSYALMHLWAILMP